MRYPQWASLQWHYLLRNFAILQRLQPQDCYKKLQGPFEEVLSELLLFQKNTATHFALDYCSDILQDISRYFWRFEFSDKRNKCSQIHIVTNSRRGTYSVTRINEFSLFPSLNEGYIFAYTRRIEF